MSVIRVAHLPGRTPYARKLTAPQVRIVNGTETRSGMPVPIDISFDWLMSQSALDFFDVLHIHSIEFADPQVVDDVLDRCLSVGRRLVFTFHDVVPMFDHDHASYRRKLQSVCAAASHVVTLTSGAAAAIREIGVVPDVDRRLAVVPHGFVLHPDDRRWGAAGTNGGKVEYALFGAFRPNRDTYALLLNWYYGLLQHEARLNLLCRSINPCDLGSDGIQLREVLAFLQSDRERMTVRLCPFPTDEQVIEFLVRNDVLVMPYRWGTHSGQLELAFDLNLIPVIPDIGYYREQWQISREFVPEPLWFDWHDGAIYNYGARLVDALLAAHEASLSRGDPRCREEYRRYRIEEHKTILRSYLAFYGAL